MSDVLRVALIVLLCVLAAFAAFMAARTPRAKKRAPLAPEPVDEALCERAAASLADAIRIPTVTGNEAAMGELHRYLRARYPLAHRRMTLETQGQTLIFHWQGSDRRMTPIAFGGHMDVVPPGHGWTKDPFGGEYEDGYVYGRGAIDCKNVVVALLEAAESLLREGFEPERSVYFIFGHDEEKGGSGAARAAELFVRRGIKLSLYLDEGGHIDPDFRGTGAAVAHIGITEKGVANMSVTAFSKGGHAARPPRHTALGSLCEAVCRIEATPLAPRLTEAVELYLKKTAPLLGWRMRFLTANLPFTRRALFRALSKDPELNALIRTTCAATMATASDTVNVLPRSASARLSVRLLHGDTAREVEERIAAIAGDLNVEVESEVLGEASLVADTHSAMARLVRRMIRRRFGEGVTAAPGLMVGATDARRFEQVCPCVLRFMPFVLDAREAARMHGADERVSAERLGQAVGFYKALMREAAQLKGTPGKEE